MLKTVVSPKMLSSTVNPQWTHRHQGKFSIPYSNLGWLWISPKASLLAPTKHTNIPFWGSINRGDSTNITQDTDRNSRPLSPQWTGRYSFLDEINRLYYVRPIIVPTIEKIQAHLVHSKYDMRLKLRNPTTDQNK